MHFRGMVTIPPGTVGCKSQIFGARALCTGVRHRLGEGFVEGDC